MRDLYSDITNDIIAAIEAGVGNYVMPWHGAAPIGLPRNGVTGAGYHGINTMILMMTARRAGYAEPVWATYRQWQEAGRQVSRGARGTCTILYKPMTVREDGSHEDEDGRRRVYIRASSLFNIAQTDGYVPPTAGAGEGQDDDSQDHITPLARAEALLTASGAVLVEGGDSAHYNRATDRIHMPDRARFDGRGAGDATAAWYTTLMHELVHWTGAGHRLDRPTGRAASAQYGFEELVAEIGSAFLMAELGITNMPVEAYAGYVANWLQALQDDRRFIFRAAAEAGKAAEYLLGMAGWKDGNDGSS